MPENRNYACEQISLWLDKLLAENFAGKDIIEQQLAGAAYKVYGEYEYISVIFAPKTNERYPYRTRVPVTMDASQPNGNIVTFLLHVADGFINEMQIYNADGTDIDGNFDVSNVSYLFAEEIALGNAMTVEQEIADDKRRLGKLMEEKKVPLGARPWVAYLVLVFGVAALLATVFRYPYYPYYSIMLGIFAIYFSLFVWLNPQAEPRQKLIAKVAAVLGVVTLLAIVGYWLIGYV